MKEKVTQKKVQEKSTTENNKVPPMVEKMQKKKKITEKALGVGCIMIYPQIFSCSAHFLCHLVL